MFLRADSEDSLDWADLQHKSSLGISHFVGFVVHRLI